jgi:hypothetical protein
VYPPPLDLESLYRNLFGPKPGGRRAAPQPRQQPAAEEAVEPAPADTGAEEGAPPAADKPKVVLRNLAWGVEKARFNDKVAIRLEADVPASLAHLTRLQIEVVALLPEGGRETLDRKELHLKDGRASGEVTVFYPQARGEEGNLLEACDLVFTAVHRESAKAESPKLPVKQPFVTNVRWEKAEEWFGTPVKLLATTCLKDGEEVAVKVASENGLALEAKARAQRGRLEVAWTPCLCGVAAGEDGKYPEKVEFYAEVSRGEEKAVPERNFFLKVVGKTEYGIFSKDYTWGKYGVHAEFNQRIEQGAIDVRVEKPIMKAWPAHLLDMRKAGMKGTVAGCPYGGYRWGRITHNGQIPNEYHDGEKWLPLPKKFRLDENLISMVGLIKQQDGRFVEGGEPSAVWPDQFEDYDFDSPDYAKKRLDWKSDTEARWSRKFLVRPMPCPSGRNAGGCGYPLDLKFEMRKVETWQSDTIAVCAGFFRSNAGCFSLEDEDIEMAAHEVGHLVGMPDEYKGGGIDPAVNGDGAVNGIDSTTIMGMKLDKVKRRHYGNFIAMTGAQVTEKIGSKITFLAADL